MIISSNVETVAVSTATSSVTVTATVMTTLMKKTAVSIA